MIDGIPLFLMQCANTLNLNYKPDCTMVKKNGIKFNTNVRAVMKKKEEDGRSANATIMPGDNVLQKVQENNSALIGDCENMQVVGSGWNLEKTNSLLHI